MLVLDSLKCCAYLASVVFQYSIRDAIWGVLFWAMGVGRDFQYSIRDAAVNMTSWAGTRLSFFFQYSIRDAEVSRVGRSLLVSVTDFQYSIRDAQTASKSAFVDPTLPSFNTLLEMRRTNAARSSPYGYTFNTLLEMLNTPPHARAYSMVPSFQYSIRDAGSPSS